MKQLGKTCGMPNLATEIQKIKTKSLDLFTTKMRNLKGWYVQTLWMQFLSGYLLPPALGDDPSILHLIRSHTGVYEIYTEHFSKFFISKISHIFISSLYGRRYNSKQDFCITHI